MSGRYNPQLNGDAQGADMMQSPLLSTDSEGIMCEMCHRSIGNVTKDEFAGSSAYNMITGVNNWPHSGDPYPQGPRPGDPFGDATLQINDGMTYAGKYPALVEVTFSDEPMVGTEYTGQTYGVLPLNWPLPTVPGGSPASIGGLNVAYNPDGSVGTHFEIPADVPRNALGQRDFQAQSISLEHPTTDASGFIKTSEFCGSCHELTVPLGTGMPEQRTSSEWADSSSTGART